MTSLLRLVAARPRRWLLPWLALVAILPWARASAQPCTDANLLAHRRPVAAPGVVRPQTLTDARVPVEGATFDGPESAVLTGATPQVTFDLGAVQTVRALYLQADNNEPYVISISDDGQTFTRAFLAPAVNEPGMRARIGRDFEWNARFVRLEPDGGDGRYAVSELQLFCRAPDPLPPSSLTVVASLAADPLGHRARLAGSWEAVVALVAIPLFLLGLFRLRGRARKQLALVIVLIGAFGWIRFGTFHGGIYLHAWDGFHYFMGPKYFDELGYTGLYACVAAHERGAGRAAVVDSLAIRDLRTNVLHPGTWSRTGEGACPRSFTGARRRAFDADVEAFRPLFPRHLPLERMLVDHGYNGTPVLTAFLKALTYFTPANRTTLVALSFIDLIAYAGAIAMLWWGFGARAAALAAIVVGTGEPWSYLWTGGSVARAVWLFFLCAGLALVRRKRLGAGAASLAVSGLLRLYPMVFLGALGLHFLVRAVRDRGVGLEARRVVGAATLTLALGIAVGGVVNGFGSYPAFVEEMRGHANLPMSNHIGVQAMISYVPGATSGSMTDARLTDPYEVVKALQRAARSERYPLWILAVLASFGLLVEHARRTRARPEDTTALAAALLFSLLAVSNYDTVWIVVLAPLAARSRFRTVLLLGFVAFTQIYTHYDGEIEHKHVVLSLAMGLVIATLSAHLLRETPEPRAVGADAEDDPEAPSPSAPPVPVASQAAPGH